MSIPPASGEPAPLDDTVALLKSASAGSDEARDELVRRYAPQLSRFLHGRLPSSARRFLETRDLVQEASMRALTQLLPFEHRRAGSFWCYLRRIALNQLADVYRKAGAQPAVEALDSRSPDPPDSAPDIGQGLLDEEQAALFESAIGGLPQREREALLLRLELDMEYGAVARECGYPSSDAARMAIKRAMAQVFERMSRRGR